MNTSELKLARIKKALSQRDLSKISGVGMNTIVKVEKGNIDGVSVGILKKLAAALGSTIQDLFFSEED